MLEISPDAQAPAVARFTGTLADFSVADLVQMLELAGKDAAITVIRDGRASQLWCSAGAIVDAESGLLCGEAALYRILGFEHGSITADLCAVPRTRSIFASTQRLLLEAAQRKDESIALRRTIGDEQRCYRLAGNVTAEHLALSAFELCVLLAFCAPCSPRQALESSELGDFETLTALAAWIEAGMLVDAGVRADPQRSVHARQASSLVSRFRARAALYQRGVFRPWVSTVLAALVLTPAGYFVGASVSRSFEPAAAPLLARPEPVAAPMPVPPTYAVQLWVEPPLAEISLDHSSAVIGYLATRLARDGRVHEVRVSAPGFVPATIFFADAAPPVRLSLEPATLEPVAAALTSTASIPTTGTKQVRGRSALPHDLSPTRLRSHSRATEGVASGVID